MPCHGMDMLVLPLSLVNPSMPHLVIRVHHTPLIVLDTSLDQMVHHVHQKREAQTCPGVHARARACTASATDTPGHVVAQTPPLTLALASSAKRFTTPR
jgi:hypothetical protein